MGEEVKLFGVWGSPFSKRVEMALKLKGVEYDFFDEDLQNKSELLLKYNPVHKKIPVLVHKGKPIAESAIILEYIDETWEGFALLPKDPYQRATARFWARFVEEKCMPAMFKCSVGTEDREKAVEEAYETLKLLENELKGKKFFGGEEIGFVDIVADFIGGYWLRDFQEVVGMELLTKEKLPKLCEWSDEFVNHAVIKEVLPPRDKLIAFFRTRFGSKP
ncbi:PREDICTED: probable glutathione S-transferase [Fragaria vesca subsp. vesca]|uniref:probable glutathione S-transferase n=1 Tax=Fragaria vesca subsp. vesca TaxID=101020 RepID=UPI0002C33216|nr:PREDICTED: probable glutathione S-transferase [Fragaria vesca subsp. vesca]